MFCVRSDTRVSAQPDLTIIFLSLTELGQVSNCHFCHKVADTPDSQFKGLKVHGQLNEPIPTLTYSTIYNYIYDYNMSNLTGFFAVLFRALGLPFTVIGTL